MRSAPGPASEQPTPANAAETPMSRERALIMAALNQVDRASTWTSRAPSSVPGGSASVSPDAPTAAESSHPSQPATAALPGKDAFPGYEIQREIHRGGQGVVYLATQLATKRRVAVKVMHGGATVGSTGRARFDREVQLLGQLNHPNIVKLHDSGHTTDGSLFYVMDYVSGRALDEVLREQRREIRLENSTSTRARSRSRTKAEGLRDVEDTLRFFAKICDGVNAAHLKGVIHRDIKPANVRVDQNNEPVLVDFGLAKVTAGVETDLDPSNPMTMTGQFIGSLPWASPEQAIGSGDAIDLRSDVYSLGVMLYQMLTGGKFPYQVIGNMRDVLDNIQRAEPARPSTVRRQINDEIEMIVLKALAKEKERRYQSAGELARDIRRYLAGEPIEAKRDSGWYVIRKTLNRHKAAAVFAATVAVLITGSAIGMTGLWRQADVARAMAVTERDRAEDNLRAVRDLANTFLYDFNDSVEHLRGATRAREIVLTKALEYLNILAAQPDKDDETLAALADAYEKAGDLHGAIYAANVGTTSQAIEYYEQARIIREDLVQRLPTDMLHRSKLAHTWQCLGETQFKREHFSEALAAYAAGIEHARAAGDTPKYLTLLVRAADVHRRVAVDLFKDHEAFAREISVGESMYAEGDAGWAALNVAQSARERALILSKLSQSAQLRGRWLADERGDQVGASEAYREGMALLASAIEAFERLVALNPADYTASRDLWVVVHHLGQTQFEVAETYQDMGMDAEAIQARAESLTSFIELRDLAESMASDPSNLEAQRDLAITVNKLGNCLRVLGRLPEARAAFAENVDRWNSLFRSDPVERHLRDLGVGQFKLAEVDEQLASAASTNAERLATLRLARSGYLGALETFRQYGERGGPAVGLIQTVQDAVGRVEAAIQDG